MSLLKGLVQTYYVKSIGRLSPHDVSNRNETLKTGRLHMRQVSLSAVARPCRSNEMVQRDTPEGGTDNALFQPYKLGRFDLEHRCTSKPFIIRFAMSMLPNDAARRLLHGVDANITSRQLLQHTYF